MRIEQLRYILYKNKFVKRDVESGYMFAEENKVNLNAWINLEKIMRGGGYKYRRLVVSYNR